MIEVARLYRLDNGESALKAFADVVIGEVLVKGIRVIEGRKGLFVSMPKTQGRDQRWYDTVRMLDEKQREKLQQVVIEAYKT